MGVLMSEDSDMTSNKDEQAQEPTPAAPQSAGGLLRQARQAKGLHIAALAVSLKIPQRKLEALEADRYSELTDATFVRALAQTVCRALKTDPAPVLALLPQTLQPRLESVSSGLNQPFRERPGREDSQRWTSMARFGPLLIIGAILVGAALYFSPSGLWRGEATAGGDGIVVAVPMAAASALAEGMFPPVVAVNTVAEPAVSAEPAPAASAIVSSAPAPAPAPAVLASALLNMRASAQTWVEVMDVNGQTLMSRNLEPGEALSLDGAVPLKLRIGNAAGISVQFRGREVDLAPHTRENVARLELK